MKSMNIATAFRLIKLLNTHKVINYKTIMDEFNVSRKQAYRYLDQIEQNFPVSSASDSGRAFRLTTDYTADNISGTSEFAFVASLLDYAKSALSTEHQQAIEMFKQKAFAANRYSTHLFINERSVDYNNIAQTVTVLEHNILSCTEVSFAYERTGKCYTVRPYKILYYKGAWYLLAEHSEIFKTFLLEQITNISTGKDFLPDIKAVEKYSKETITIWQNSNTPPEKVKVRFDAIISTHFKSRQILPEQKIEKELNNGDLDISFDITSTMELQHLLMPWFPQFRILSPIKYKNFIDKLIEIYKEKMK